MIVKYFHLSGLKDQNEQVAMLLINTTEEKHTEYFHNLNLGMEHLF